MRHNCVIVPDLGGFVVNREPAHINAEGVVIAPRVSFAFNQDLKYNDGLLAEAYMSENGGTYEEACLSISNAVKSLNIFLSVQKKIEIGRVGSLAIDKENGNVVFFPNRDVFYHPLIFGDSNLNLQPLDRIKEIEAVVEIKKKRFEMKRVIGSVAASAAAILLFFVASTPIAESGANNVNMQKSGFLTNILYTNSEKKVSEDSAEPTVAEEKEVVSPDNKQNVAAISVDAPADAKPKSKASVSYYLIIAGEATQNAANKRLAKIKEAGFANAKILDTPQRKRVYIASFDKKVEAEDYLSHFKTLHPRYSDAWIFAKK
ncbi:SPOR domain-containing protein [Dysgonomonas sp. 520]|nr:SPOR domain-containing protein [Dysgonomonas sp. 520]